jgi:MoxR-like ATPase
VVEQSLGAEPQVREVMPITELDKFREIASRVFVDRRVIGYAVALADATRNPKGYGLDDLEPYIAYGASPRGPIGLVQAARALAMLRGRSHVAIADIRDLALDILRHRIVLSYDGLSEGVSVDDLLERVLGAVPRPESEPHAEAA